MRRNWYGITSKPTHLITVPGTKFKCWVNENFTDLDRIVKEITKASKKRPAPIPVVTKLDTEETQ